MEIKLYDAEYRFINIIWELEPINSTELVKECSARLGWKKSTTYTMIKKLSDRAILRNEDTMVSTLIKREEIIKMESEALMKKSFDNSLPAFLATFLQDKKLTATEAEKIKKMIEEATE
ncbi:MAG: BlaI/MecI/CopY family transcriptional regulator [Clostridia bacterium]|nr:BlaI/MecI/CopY family transcriptional regulator [Clostridia bacterium]